MYVPVDDMADVIATKAEGSALTLRKSPDPANDDLALDQWSDEESGCFGDGPYYK